MLSTDVVLHDFITINLNAALGMKVWLEALLHYWNVLSAESIYSENCS